MAAYGFAKDMGESEIVAELFRMYTRTIRSMSGNATYMLRYTKGFVLNDKEMTAEEYQIKSINGKDFLFVQHKSGDYFYGGMTPHWYVFERKDN